MEVIFKANRVNNAIRLIPATAKLKVIMEVTGVKQQHIKYRQKAITKGIIEN